MNRFLRFAPAVLLLFAACAACATDNVVQVGDVTIRYNALSADALPEASAKAYGLEHSAGQGLVNVLVSRDGDGSGVAAKVSGKAMTLLGAPVPIKFRIVNESGSQSYLGTFQVPGPGALHFVLSVTPVGEATQTIDFTQDFVGD
jgi:Domain of unknown function (DUF4426)